MNQMGTTDTWISSCTRAEPAVLCRERGTSAAPAQPGAGLPEPFIPLPSLLPAPCLAPWAAWPGMSLVVNPLFEPRLGEVSQKGRAPPGQGVRAGRSSGIALSCRSSSPCTRGHRGAHGQLGLFTFVPCLFVFKSQRIPDWFGVGGASSSSCPAPLRGWFSTPAPRAYSHSQLFQSPHLTIIHLFGVC